MIKMVTLGEKETLSGARTGHDIVIVSQYCIFQNTKGYKELTIYSMITLFDTFEILCIWKFYVKWNICSLGANVPFSVIFSKVFKTLFNFFLYFFSMCLKIENDVMI